MRFVRLVLSSIAGEILGVVLFFAILAAAVHGIGNENRWVHWLTITALVGVPITVCAWIVKRLVLARSDDGESSSAAELVFRGSLLVVCLFLMSALVTAVWVGG